MTAKRKEEKLTGLVSEMGVEIPAAAGVMMIVVVIKECRKGNRILYRRAFDIQGPPF
ncbi:hypothetical protein [Clostridium sp. Marseille-P2415]|uniref:hypothetical protein n=1 Tax=Clostridium sp. Marseille-P2415 TaxID=1805471 RepID=UPI0013564971|nr:hypothetical protein [Clostridium sp. Marseille-P2415]